MRELTDAEDTHSHGHGVVWPSAGCAGISRSGGPRIRADRGSEALAPRTPSATLADAARCERKTASGMTDGRGALAQTIPSDARILNGLRVPEAARPGGHVRRGRFVPGPQSPSAWRYSFLWDTTPEHGSHVLSKNSSARVSHKFNAFLSSRPAQWVMHAGAHRQRLACPSLSPCVLPDQPSALAGEDHSGVSPQAWPTLTTATFHSRRSAGCGGLRGFAGSVSAAGRLFCPPWRGG